MFVPPLRTIRWPFSAFATVIMVVFPVFWPVLAVFLALEILCLGVFTAWFLVGNLVMLIVAVVRASGRHEAPL